MDWHGIRLIRCYVLNQHLTSNEVANRHHRATVFHFYNKVILWRKVHVLTTNSKPRSTDIGHSVTQPALRPRSRSRTCQSVYQPARCNDTSGTGRCGRDLQIRQRQNDAGSLGRRFEPVHGSWFFLRWVFLGLRCDEAGSGSGTGFIGFRWRGLSPPELAVRAMPEPAAHAATDHPLKWPPCTADCCSTYRNVGRTCMDRLG